MRIGMLAPIAWRTPPRHYGPWEQVVSLLTEGLVARGADVTLFATGDSVTTARLVSVCPRGYEEDRSVDAKVWEALHTAELFERSRAFDLIHNHFDFLPLVFSGLVKTPVVTTIHGFSSARILPVYRKYNTRVHYLSIMTRIGRRTSRISARCTTGSICGPLHSANNRMAISCSLAASTLTRGRRKRSTSRARRDGSW
jgi:glycosyltransferase involved in cell wall biosynthesis